MNMLQEKTGLFSRKPEIKTILYQLVFKMPFPHYNNKKSSEGENLVQKTSSYEKSYFDEDVDLFEIYRYMDKLYDTQKEEVQRISVEHTRKVLGGQVGLMFYDVTTLYFESSKVDVLREPGFSKDGKTAETQIVLGLLVSRDGYPLSYCIFNGSQYEGYTMLPVIDDFIQRFSLSDFVVVADAGLMSKRNVKLLEDAGYKYIIGARIHTEGGGSLKDWILEQPKLPGKYHEHEYGNNARLILGYYRKTNRGPYLYMLYCVQGVQRAGAYHKTCKDRPQRRRSTQNCQDCSNYKDQDANQ